MKTETSNLLQVKVHWYYLFLIFVLLLWFILILIHNSSVCEWDNICVSHSIHRIHQAVSCKSLGDYPISTFHLPGTTLGLQMLHIAPHFIWVLKIQALWLLWLLTAYPLSHHHALNWNTLISSIMHVISLHVKIIYRYKWWRFLPFILCHPLRKTMHIFIYEFKQNYIAEISSKNLTTKT